MLVMLVMLVMLGAVRGTSLRIHCSPTLASWTSLRIRCSPGLMRGQAAVCRLLSAGVVQGHFLNAETADFFETSVPMHGRGKLESGEARSGHRRRLGRLPL
jgi:hypothetical protein